MSVLSKLTEGVKRGIIPPQLAASVQEFYQSYSNAIAKNGYRIEDLDPVILQFFDLVLKQLTKPYAFEIFHQRILSPINYRKFGLDLIRPLVIFEKSKIHGIENLNAIEKILTVGENVILLSNHQTEPDPQAIDLLLEKTHPQLSKDMIFVAGHRVVSDPLAVPFSMGVNLLCIFSKKYVENPPDQKHEKLMHNRRTMKKMTELLNEGGKCIYVACSGGRDRPDATGKFQVAPFDPNGIEMFRLMAHQAERKTHFHTLALNTHHLQPPPNTIEHSLGEKREVNATPIHLAFGPEIDMDGCVAHVHDKHEKRKIRAQHIWKKVAEDYAKL